jgi:hypothetical protein
VIEGVYYAWLAESFQQADLIAILQPSVWVRDGRIIKRFARRTLGGDHSKGESFRSLIDLLKYNHAFDGGQLVRARKAMREQDARVLEASSLEDVIGAL